MVSCTFIIMSLAASACVSGFTTKIESLTAGTLPELKTGDVAMTFNAPPFNHSAITKSPVAGLKDRSLSPRWTISTPPECLDPLDAPVSADCESIYENLSLQQGPLQL